MRWLIVGDFLGEAAGAISIVRDMVELELLLFEFSELVIILLKKDLVEDIVVILFLLEANTYISKSLFD